MQRILSNYKKVCKNLSIPHSIDMKNNEKIMKSDELASVKDTVFSTDLLNRVIRSFSVTTLVDIVVNPRIYEHTIV
jgi:hypothetical protein